MKDKKVIETLREMEQEDAYMLNLHRRSPLLFFAEAVAISRKEPGVSIEEIGKCFRYQFDEEELFNLRRELKKGKL